jgi:3-oxoacid CoA-transferase
VIKYKRTETGIEPEIVAPPKLVKTFRGRRYLEEESIFADFALIKAWRADTMGNLEFHKTARNFNADMALAAKCVIAEVEEIVEAGTLDPEAIHVPAIYVDRVYKMNPSSRYSESVIERLTLEDHVEVKRGVKFSSIAKGELNFNDHPELDAEKQIRYKIAARAAKEVKSGMSINLGIGIPTCLPNVLPPDVKVFIQSENGVLGVGHHPLLE